METSHEEFNTIIREKQKYGRMNENVRNVSEKLEKIILNKNRNKTKNKFVKVWLVKKYCTFALSKNFFVCIYIMSQISKEAYKKCEVEIIDKGK